MRLTISLFELATYSRKRIVGNSNANYDMIIKMEEKAIEQNSISVAKVEEILKSVNINPSSLSPELKSRLVLLDRYTPTIDDEHQAISYALKVFDQAEKSGHPYSDAEKRVVMIGTLFTDIGKSGRKDATIQQSELIVSMYSKENIPIEDTQGSVQNFLTKYFSEENPKEKIALFQSLKLVSNMTMRDFYNLHTQWTFDILDASDLPKEIVPVASCHHRLRGDNPRNILNDDDSYIRTFGSRTRYGRSEKLVGLLDQYDAFRRRSGLIHKETILKLQELVSGAVNGRYTNDMEFQEIIKDIDASLNPNPEA